MQTINYYCPYSEQTFLGVLVKEEDRMVHIAEPLLYFWLKKVNRLDVLSQTYLRPYMKNDHFYYKQQDFDESTYPSSSVLFHHFPILSYDVAIMHHITLFFEHFFAYCHGNAVPFVQVVERCVKNVQGLVPDRVLSDMVQFVIGHFGKEERVRVLFSPTVSPFLPDGGVK